MTASERAKQIVDSPPFLDYIRACRAEVAEAIRSAIEEERDRAVENQQRAITAAVENEREACAKIADEVQEARHVLNHPEGALAAKIIAANIRALSKP